MKNRIQPIRVSFVFASHGIGGAEKSMLRLIQAAHPHTLNCEVIFSGTDNLEFAEALNASLVPIHRVNHYDVISLQRHFKAFRPDVAYLFGQVRSLLWTLAARLAKVPVVIGAERCTLDRRVDIIGRKLDRFVIDHYISNSQKAARELIERVDVAEQRVHVVYNGLPVPVEPPLPLNVENEHTLGKPSIICVANLQPRKGQIYLLQAVQQLRAKYPRIRAVLVGKDLTNGELIRHFEAAGLSDCYTWTGFTSNVRSYLAHADVFVLPSLYFEGMPTAILEAMAEGVPVIASDVGGVSELVIDGETGLLVSPGNTGILVEKLRCLLNSPALRQRLVTNAFQLVRQRHTVKAMIEGHVTSFRQALTEKGYG